MVTFCVEWREPGVRVMRDNWGEGEGWRGDGSRRRGEVEEGRWREKGSVNITRKQSNQQMITYFALCSRDWAVNDEYCSGQSSDPNGEWNVSNTLTACTIKLHLHCRQH